MSKENEKLRQPYIYIKNSKSLNKNMQVSIDNQDVVNVLSNLVLPGAGAMDPGRTTRLDQMLMDGSIVADEVEASLLPWLVYEKLKKRPSLLNINAVSSCYAGADRFVVYDVENAYAQLMATLQATECKASQIAAIKDLLYAEGGLGVGKGLMLSSPKNTPPPLSTAGDGAGASNGTGAGAGAGASNGTGDGAGAGDGDGASNGAAILDMWDYIKEQTLASVTFIVQQMHPEKENVTEMVQRLFDRRIKLDDTATAITFDLNGPDPIMITQLTKLVAPEWVNPLSLPWLFLKRKYHEELNKDGDSPSMRFSADFALPLSPEDAFHEVPHNLYFNRYFSKGFENKPISYRVVLVICCTYVLMSDYLRDSTSDRRLCVTYCPDNRFLISPVEVTVAEATDEQTTFRISKRPFSEL